MCIATFYWPIACILLSYDIWLHSDKFLLSFCIMFPQCSFTDFCVVCCVQLLYDPRINCFPNDHCVWLLPLSQAAGVSKGCYELYLAFLGNLMVIYYPNGYKTHSCWVYHCSFLRKCCSQILHWLFLCYNCRAIVDLSVIERSMIDNSLIDMYSSTNFITTFAA